MKGPMNYSLDRMFELIVERDKALAERDEARAEVARLKDALSSLKQAVRSHLELVARLQS